MKPPQGKNSTTVGKPINLIDIFPGLLNLMGVSEPNCFQGVSAFDETKKRNAIYLHSNAIVQQDGIVKWPWKLLSNTYPIKYFEVMERFGQEDMVFDYNQGNFQQVLGYIDLLIAEKTKRVKKIKEALPIVRKLAVNQINYIERMIE